MKELLEPLRHRIVRPKEECKQVSLEKLRTIEEAFAPPEELADILLDEKMAPELRPSVYEYLSTMHFLNVLSQFLLAHPDPALNAHADLLDEAHREYMPEGPPISPVTASHYNCWMFMDARISDEEGSLSEAILRLGPELGLDGHLRELVQLVTCSRMGVYAQVGFDDGLFVLRELLTNKEYRVRCNSDYEGRDGVLWFVRLLPSRTELNTHFVLSTPYIIENSEESDWLAYFARCGIQQGQSDLESRLQTHMKEGLSPYYWLEYIFEGYLGHHGSSCICLTGVPDDADSLPHSREG